MPQPGLPIELATKDALVKKALNLMQQTMDAPLTVERLAERLGVGRQRIEQATARERGLDQARLELGLGAKAHVLQRQLAQARQALDGPHLVLQIEREQAREPTPMHARRLLGRIVGP